jgi:hypothetical protein
MRPAVAGVDGLDAVILGEDRASGKGSDDELKRGSDMLRSKWGGRGRGSNGCLRVDCEDCGLVRELALPGFGRVSAGSPPFAGALAILLESFALLARVDPGVVVLLRTTFCCVWLASDMTSPVD